MPGLQPYLDALRGAFGPPVHEQRPRGFRGFLRENSEGLLGAGLHMLGGALSGRANPYAYGEAFSIFQDANERKRQRRLEEVDRRQGAARESLAERDALRERERSEQEIRDELSAQRGEIERLRETDPEGARRLSMFSGHKNANKFWSEAAAISESRQGLEAAKAEAAADRERQERVLEGLSPEAQRRLRPFLGSEGFDVQLRHVTNDEFEHARTLREKAAEGEEGPDPVSDAQRRMLAEGDIQARLAGRKTEAERIAEIMDMPVGQDRKDEMIANVRAGKDPTVILDDDYLTIRGAAYRGHFQDYRPEVSRQYGSWTELGVEPPSATGGRPVQDEAQAKALASLERRAGVSGKMRGAPAPISTAPTPELAAPHPSPTAGLVEMGESLSLSKGLQGLMDQVTVEEGEEAAAELVRAVTAARRRGMSDAEIEQRLRRARR